MSQQHSSLKEDERFLSQSSKSKGKFVQRYKQFYHGKPESKNLYLLILTKLHTAVSKGNIANFKMYESLIDFISGEESLETFTIYYKDSSNIFKTTNLIILACKFGNLEILDHIFSFGTILYHLSENVGKDFPKPNDEDEMRHTAFYYAVRSSNVKLLETLIDKWPSNYFIEHSEKLEEVLSTAYEELKFKNVSVSDEMIVFVENKLINLRFFSGPYKLVQKGKNKLNNIKERINLVLENIDLLNTEYSNDEEVDNKFIYVTRFIAQNIHVLKRQLKSTYDEMPWEEIEFCLTSFISSHIEKQELDALCCVVLNKKKILCFLKNFAKKLDIMKIVDVFKLTKLPDLPREEVVAKIMKKNPQFVELYHDFRKIRDIYSLHIMSCYVSRASSVNPKSRTGQLCIIRALQVIGENLKNTWISPKLSDDTSKLLLFFLSKHTKAVIEDLRDSLSHTYSLQMRIGIEKNVNSRFFFASIQDDINKVGVTIEEILHDKKLDVILTLFEKIMNCKKSTELEEYFNILHNIPMISMITTKFISKEQKNIETYIMELKNNINGMTVFEKNRFDEIHKIIDSKKQPVVRLKTDYTLESMNFLLGMKKLHSCDKKEITTFIEDVKANILPRVGTSDLKQIANVVLQIRESITSRSEDQQCGIVSKIFHIAQFETSEIKGIEKMNTTLGSGGDEENAEDYGLKIGENYQGELDRKLSALRNILKEYGLHDQIVEKLPSYKKDKKLQSALEMLVLDILSILGELRSSLPRNIFFLDDIAPLLIGRPLRNYIAHSDILINVLSSSNPSIALLLNAIKLSERNLMNNVCNIGKLLQDDPFKLKEKYTVGLAAIINQQKMFTALVEGKLDDLKESLKLGADLNAKCFNSQTALHFAAMGPNLDVLKFVCSRNLSLNVKDGNGQTPLHVAAAYGRNNIAEFIVKGKSVCVNDVNNDRNTPLHMAAQNGHKSIVELLLKNMADPSIKNIEGFTPLYFAAQNNHTKVVKILLGEEMNVDVYKVEGNLTLLHIASRYGCLGLVKFLLVKNADITAMSDNGWTALHYSAKNGTKEIACALLERGANINSRSIQGDTPLHIAVEYGNISIVKILLNKGADVNVRSSSDNITPLHSAAEKGYYEIVQLLLDKGADTNSKDRENFTPLHTSALRECHSNVIEALIRNKSDINAKNSEGNTPLHLVVKSSKEKAIKIFLKYGANVHIKNKYNYTPVELAALKGNLHILKLLLQHEDAHLTINSKGYNDSTLLHLAARVGNVDVVGYLMVNGANINCKTEPDMETPLHFVAEIGNYELAKMLIKKGANVSARNKKGIQPIHVAAACGHQQVIETLMQAKADVNASNSDNLTPLYCAAQYGHLDVIEVLLDKGASVDVKASNGFTPLCAAIETGNLKIVEKLIQKGAKTSIVCNDELTPLHLAASNGYASIVELLLKYECNINGRSAQDSTAIELAVLNNHIATVKILLEDERVNINSTDGNNYTILHSAAQMGHTNMVKYLIKKGADLNMKTIHGYIPLNLAIYKGHIETVEAFKMENTSTNAKCNADKSAEEMESCFVYRHLHDSNGCRLSNFGSKAKECLPEFLKLREKHYGPSHPKTAEVLLRMGEVEMASGNYQKAEELLEQALKILNSNYDSENIHLVETLINLGKIYAKIGNPHKHKDVVECALKIQEKRHGTESSELIEALISLSIAYGNLSNQSKKKELLEQALKIQEKHDIDHLKMAETLINLSNTYGALGNPQKQKELLEETLKLQKKHFGSDHISIAITLNNLSKFSIGKKDFLSAKKQLEQALQIKKKHYGNDHPELLNTLLNLGSIHKCLGDYEQCIKALHQALTIQKKLYGANHIELADTLLNLGLAYGALCDFQKNKELCEEAVSISEMHYGPDHFKVNDKLLNLGVALAELQNHKEAINLFKRVLKIQEEYYGVDHFKILGVLNNLSKCCDALGFHEKNLEILERALNIKQKHYGSEHESIVITLMELSLTYKALGNHQKEKVVIEQAVKIQEKSTGCDSIEVARMLTNLSSAYLNLGDYLHAQKLLENVRVIFEKTLGPHSPEFLRISLTLEMLNQQYSEGDGILQDFPHLGEPPNVNINDDEQIVQCLLKGNNDVNCKDAEGRTPLHYAINGGKFSVVLILLEKGADVTQATNKGNTPLHTATSKDYVEIVELLLQHISHDKLKEYINAKTTSNGTTSLHIAAKNGCLDVVKALLKYGAIYNVANNEGKLPLHLTKNQEVANLLNFIEELFRYVEKGDVEVTNKLKALKPDEFSVVTNACNDQGYGLLQFASIMSNKYRCIENELSEFLKR